jgi:hypothetical protein
MFVAVMSVVVIDMAVVVISVAVVIMVVAVAVVSVAVVMILVAVVMVIVAVPVISMLVTVKVFHVIVMIVISVRESHIKISAVQPHLVYPADSNLKLFIKTCQSPSHGCLISSQIKKRGDYHITADPAAAFKI